MYSIIKYEEKIFQYQKPFFKEYLFLGYSRVNHIAIDTPFSTLSVPFKDLFSTRLYYMFFPQKHLEFMEKYFFLRRHT